MSEKQQEYLEKLETFKFYYTGKHYGKTFAQVYDDYRYWEPFMKRDVSSNKTLSSFKVYVDLKRKCCWKCGGSGQEYGFDDMTLPCEECNVGERARFLGLEKQGKIEGGSKAKKVQNGSSLSGVSGEEEG